MGTNIYQTFRRFLRDNNCERQFDAAFYEQCGANYFDQTLADYMVIDEGFFGRVFRWDLTPEGREFWKDIDGKWWAELDDRLWKRESMCYFAQANNAAKY